MFLLYVLAPIGHLQGHNLQRNTFIVLCTIYVCVCVLCVCVCVCIYIVKYNVINHNISGYMCKSGGLNTAALIQCQENRKQQTRNPFVGGGGPHHSASYSEIPVPYISLLYPTTT
jgi:hypothetical protein